VVSDQTKKMRRQDMKVIICILICISVDIGININISWDHISPFVLVFLIPYLANHDRR